MAVHGLKSPASTWLMCTPRTVCTLVAPHHSMPGRTDQQCMGRWKRHLDPGICRAPWTAVEDALLTSLVAEHGHAWSTISSALEGRIAQQCRSRWKQLNTVRCVCGGHTLLFKINSTNCSRTHRRHPKRHPRAPPGAQHAALPTARLTAAVRATVSMSLKRTRRLSHATPRRSRPMPCAGGCSMAWPSQPAAAAAWGSGCRHQTPLLLHRSRPPHVACALHGHAEVCLLCLQKRQSPRLSSDNATLRHSGDQ